MTQHSSPRRERSRNMVMNVLKTEPKRFKDLQEETGLSAAGLDEIRKILLEEKKIVRELIGKKAVYRLTKKGEKSFDRVFLISHKVERIIKNNGVHHPNISQNTLSLLSCNLPWGIDSDLIVDERIDSLNLLSSDDVLDIEKFIFEKLSKNIPKKQLDDKKIGDVVLGFSIDYQKLLDSIKQQSLLYAKHMLKEERKLLEKMDDDIESFTSREYTRLDVLRKRTYEKIKN